MKEYDENTAIKMMNAAAGTSYDEDELLNIIDMIWDYYEQNGLLDPSLDDDDDPEGEGAELADIIDYVSRMVKKDRRCKVLLADVAALVAAELEYESTISDED